MAIEMKDTATIARKYAQRAQAAVAEALHRAKIGA